MPENKQPLTLLRRRFLAGVSAGSVITADRVLRSSEAAAESPHPNERPVALCWEIGDRWTRQTGAMRMLDAVGFEARPFDPNDGLSHDADLLVLGSFVSENGDYRTWAKEKADEIERFLRRGGVVLQFTQADQTETTPPFLPDGLEIRRTDRDGDPVLVLDDDHLLLKRLPRQSVDANRLRLPMHHRRGSWETLDRPEGFRLLAALQPNGFDPVIAEAAVGKGRLLLTSLFFDCLDDSDGNQVAPDAFAKCSQQFFIGLREYVDAVRAGNAREVVPSPTPKLPDPLEFVPGSVTMVALPDTQIYSERYPQHFRAQTEWIVANQEKHNIAAVFHEGDITNRNTPEQWENAQRAMSVLFGKLPVIAAPGNHDMGPGGNGATHESLMSRYLTEDRFRSHESFAGTFQPGQTENNYSLFAAGGQKWIGIALEWAPRDAVVAWADKLLGKHSDRRAILVTHAYMYYDDTRYDYQLRQDQRWSPYNYGVRNSEEGINDAGDLWRKLLDKHPNVAMVLSGHVLGDGAGRLTDVGKAGNSVHQMLANYQMLREGGEGWLRLIEFLPDGETIHVKTYSPVLDQYNTKAQHQFMLKRNPAANHAAGC